MSQFGLPPAVVDACVRGDIQSVAEMLQKQRSSGAALTTEKEEKENAGNSGRVADEGGDKPVKKDDKAKKDVHEKEHKPEADDKDMELD
ncbi:unnamed protein product [Soboliphyme baturini]|uniref:CUE domain-containing protein n=1 Tax=Soboliphyme baturini TaxID=241478 RepID=A0A183J7X8_9BILA|nr:unnamed protein product [Soboliphyme baturini]